MDFLDKLDDILFEGSEDTFILAEEDEPKESNPWAADSRELDKIRDEIIKADADEEKEAPKGGGLPNAPAIRKQADRRRDGYMGVGESDFKGLKSSEPSMKEAVKIAFAEMHRHKNNEPRTSPNKKTAEGYNNIVKEFIKSQNSFPAIKMHLRALDYLLDITEENKVPWAFISKNLEEIKAKMMSKTDSMIIGDRRTEIARLYEKVFKKHEKVKESSTTNKTISLLKDIGQRIVDDGGDPADINDWVDKLENGREGSEEEEEAEEVEVKPEFFDRLVDATKSGMGSALEYIKGALTPDEALEDPEEEGLDPEEEGLDPEEEGLDPEEEGLDPEEERLPEEEELDPEEEELDPEEELEDSAAEVDPTEEGEPEDSAEEIPKPRERNHARSSKGSKNIAIVKRSEDAALVRLKGHDSFKKKQVYKYLTVSSDEIRSTLGDPEANVGEINDIWDYVMAKNQDEESKFAFRKSLTYDANEAFSEYEDLVERGGGGGEAPDLSSYIERHVGDPSSRPWGKDLLINAYRNYVNGDRPPRTTKDLKDGKSYGKSPEVDLLPIISSLKDKQVRRLFDFFSDIEETKVTDSHVQAFLKRLKGDYDPRAMVEGIIKRIDAILEEDDSLGNSIDNALIDEGIFDYLEAMKNKAVDRMGGSGASFWASKEEREKQNEAKTLIKLAYKFDSLVNRLVSSTRNARRAFKSAGVDISKFPDLGGAMGRSEPEEAVPPHRPEGSTGRDAPAEPWPNDERTSERLAGSSALNKAQQHSAQWVDGYRSRPDQSQGKKSDAPKAQQHSAEWGDRVSGEDEDDMPLPPNVRSTDGTPREDYARIVGNNIMIEEARLTANDHVTAALDIYVNKCNELNRESISEMYNGRTQEMFNEALLEARAHLATYVKFLSKNGIQLEGIESNDLFGELISIIQLTSDPLSENFDKIMFSDPQLLKEAYHAELIGKKEKGDYVPLSNIF